MPHIGYFPIIYYPKPLSVNPSAFLSVDDQYDWLDAGLGFQNRASVAEQEFHAPVCLPTGARVTKLTLYGYRDDVLATLRMRLQRVRPGYLFDLMAEVVADWTGGGGSGYDDTIDFDVIDNDQYHYRLNLTLDPNDAVGDVCLYWAKIDWT